MSPSSPAPGAAPGASDSTVREAESALRRLGYSRVAARPRSDRAPRAQFWVQEPGVPRRLYPVFIEEGSSTTGPTVPPDASRPAILVVPDEARAEVIWRTLRNRAPRAAVDPELSILVLSPEPSGGEEAHWHTGIIDRRELLLLSTGIIVGLFRRASAGGEGPAIDFEELLQVLRQRFHIDLEGTLGAAAEEDQLWMMYQLALRYSYAPGDPGGNLHMLVLKPAGPSARLPWFSG